jgi:hypothetical protein
MVDFMVDFLEIILQVISMGFTWDHSDIMVF